MFGCHGKCKPKCCLCWVPDVSHCVVHSYSLHNDIFAAKVASKSKKHSGAQDSSAPLACAHLLRREKSMPYIRQHGAQLALVHGERNKTTGAVEQKILFSLYSQEEAQAATGKSDAKDKARFRALIEEAYPSIKFNWPKLTNEIESKIGHLPERYEEKSADLGATFESSLKTFARELMLTNPNGFHDAAAKELINQHRSKLVVLKELIEQTLEDCSEDRSRRMTPIDEDLDPTPDEFTKNEFAWHYLLRGTDCPLDMEEWGTSAKLC
jgi:hypothetical protein